MAYSTRTTRHHRRTTTTHRHPAPGATLTSETVPEGSTLDADVDTEPLAARGSRSAGSPLDDSYVSGGTDVPVTTTDAGSPGPGASWRKNRILGGVGAGGVSGSYDPYDPAETTAYADEDSESPDLSRFNNDEDVYDTVPATSSERQWRRL